MASGVFFAIMAGLAWTAVGFVFGVAARKLEFSFFMFASSALSTLLALLFAVDWKGAGSVEASSSTLLALLAMAVVALFSAAGFQAMKEAMNSGKRGAAWALAQSSLLMPFAAAMLFWKEPATGAKLAGLAFLLAGLPLLSLGGRDESASGGGSLKWVFSAFLAFLLIGISQIASMIPSHLEGWVDNGGLRVPVFFAVSTVLWLPVVLLKGSFKLRADALALAAVYAAVVLAGQLLLYKALDELSRAGASSIAYPAAIGVCILGCFVCNAVFLKERASLPGMAGAACALCGTGFLIAA